MAVYGELVPAAELHAIIDAAPPRRPGLYKAGAARHGVYTPPLQVDACVPSTSSHGQAVTMPVQ